MGGMPGMGQKQGMGNGFNDIFGNIGAPLGGGPPNFSAGPGQKVLDSFTKDGFNIMGKNPVPKKEEPEGSKEFAELFSLADTKIKDRTHEKPKYDLNYNPAQV